MRDEKEEYHVPFPQELSSYLLTNEEAESREKWIHSLYPEPQPEETDIENPGAGNTDADSPQEEAESGNPIEEKTPPEIPQGTDTEPPVPSPINPEDLRKSLSAGSVMELSKFISDLQKEGVADDKLMLLLKRILAARRARKIPEKTLLDDAVEALLKIDKQHDKIPEEEKTDSSLPEPQGETGVPENSVTSKSGSAGPVFEGTTKGAVGKMIPGKDGTYILLKGSTVSLQETSSFGEKQKERRESLLKKSVLIRNPDGRTATLTEDMAMKTPSEAASFVTGSNTNGWTFWKYNGKTLNEYPELT